MSDQQRGRAFEFEQGDFRLDPATSGEASEAGGGQDPVAWDQNRDRVGAAGLADGLGRNAEIGGEVAIGPGLAEGDGAEPRGARGRSNSVRVPAK